MSGILRDWNSSVKEQISQSDNKFIDFPPIYIQNFWMVKWSFEQIPGKDLRINRKNIPPLPTNFQINYSGKKNCRLVEM